MTIYYNGNQVQRVFYGSQEVQRIYYGTELVWENWVTKTGELAKRTWSGGSREGLVYSSGEIALAKPCKIHEFTLHSKVLRTDINGRVSGKFIVYGWNGSSWITLLNAVSDTSNEWDKSFTRASASTSEVTKVKYEFYVNDTIWRSYTSDLRLHISKWEQKGA
ncbi:MAG: hypothetical protein J6D33_08590 [Turicibacter sp.]|nr:hypothetical protein [Turicibacter sp.]